MKMSSFGSAAYIVAKNGAKELLSRTNTYCEAVDLLLFFKRPKSLRVSACVLP
jgi:hypothetical protein